MLILGRSLPPNPPPPSSLGMKVRLGKVVTDFYSLGNMLPSNYMQQIANSEWALLITTGTLVA